MEELRNFLAEQNLTDFTDEIDVLEAKCHGMEQHIQHLEQAVNSIRLDVAKRAMQGLIASEIDEASSAEEIARMAVEHADALLLELKGMSAMKS